MGRRVGRRLLAIGVLTVIAAAGSAIPAVAMTGGFQCDSGNSHFICDISTSGGTAPYSYSWVVLRNATITHDNGSDVVGTCFAGVTTKLQVTVTDSTGTQVVIQPVIGCSSGPF